MGDCKLFGFHFWMTLANILFIVGYCLIISKEIVLIGVELNKTTCLLLPALAG